MRRLALPILFCSALFAADQVVLTNGDTITGTIIKKDGDKLTIKSEFLGDVTMPWTAVKTIRSDSDVFVQLPSGETVKGKLATQGADLQVAAGPESKSAPLAQVTAVRDEAEQHRYERLLKPGIFELWTGYFDLAMALARGNARTDTFTTTFNALRETRNDKLAINIVQLYGTSRVNGISSTAANAIRGGWRYDRKLTPRLYVGAYNTYEHDQFQNLNLRFVLGGLVGYNVIKTDRLTVAAEAGVDYSHESFHGGLSRNSAEAAWGNTLIYKVNGTTSFTQAFHMYNNLSDLGEYRFNFDVGLATAIRKWMSFQFTGSNRYLTNPVAGRYRNDVLVSAGLRLTFAH